MTHPPYLREKARQLRRDQGLTIDEISMRLGLSRSTIYSWTRDVTIERKPGTGWPSGAQEKGTRTMQEKFRRARHEAYELGCSEFPKRSSDPSFRDFVCMYIGEGYRRNRNRVALANSDPAVISLAFDWIKRFAQGQVDLSLQYHADQDELWLRRFWAFRLGVEPDEIRLQRKSNSNQLTGRNWRSRHGVLTVGANDTALRARLQGWIDRTKEGWVAE